MVLKSIAAKIVFALFTLFWLQEAYSAIVTKAVLKATIDPHTKQYYVNFRAFPKESDKTNWIEVLKKDLEKTQFYDESLIVTPEFYLGEKSAWGKIYQGRLFASVWRVLKRTIGEIR